MGHLAVAIIHIAELLRDATSRRAVHVADVGVLISIAIVVAPGNAHAESEGREADLLGDFNESPIALIFG